MQRNQLQSSTTSFTKGAPNIEQYIELEVCRLAWTTSGAEAPVITHESMNFVMQSMHELKSLSCQQCPPDKFRCMMHCHKQGSYVTQLKYMTLIK